MTSDTSQLGRLRYALSRATFTQPFGPSNLSGEPAYRGVPHFHKGVDIVFQNEQRGNVSHPPKIYSPASGRVDFAGCPTNGCSYGLGKHIEIVAPNGFKYVLGHLAELQTSAGQYVRAGDILGVQGSTGYSTGNHLHLEIQTPDRTQVVNPGRNWGEVIWTLGHGLGYGLGYAPLFSDVGITEDNPPSPYASPLTPRAALNSQLPFQATGWGQPGGGTEGGPPPGGEDTGTTGGHGLFDVRVPSLDAVNTYVANNVVPSLFVLTVGVVLAVAGLRRLGQEKPVQAVTNLTITPSVQAAKKFRARGKRIGAAVATRGASEAAGGKGKGKVPGIVKAPLTSDEGTDVAPTDRPRTPATTRAPIETGAHS